MNGAAFWIGLQAHPNPGPTVRSALATIYQPFLPKSKPRYVPHGLPVSRAKTGLGVRSVCHPEQIGFASSREETGEPKSVLNSASSSRYEPAIRHTVKERQAVESERLQLS